MRDVVMTAGKRSADNLITLNPHLSGMMDGLMPVQPPNFGGSPLSRTAANLLLLLAAFFWGAGNVAQKTVLEHLGPVTTVGLRCAIAALVLAPFTLLLRGPAMQAGFAASATAVGILFAAALTVQQSAYGFTSVTNASFLVNTCVVITPILAWAWIRERPGWSMWIAAPLTLCGALMMSGAGIQGLTPGDAACILSAALYAAWMVQLGIHLQKFGAPAATALVQFALGAVLCLPAGLMVEKAGLNAVGAAGLELFILGVFSTAGAFGLQTVAQRHTPASHAAVIVSAESVFGAAGAFLLLSERTSAQGLAGAVLIVGAIGLISLRPGRQSGVPPPQAIS
jgi:drug/metabolite transporter (DMT)-like permease